MPVVERKHWRGRIGGQIRVSSGFVGGEGADMVERRGLDLVDLGLVAIGLICVAGLASVPSYLEYRARERLARDVDGLRLVAYQIDQRYPDGRYPPSQEYVQGILDAVNSDAAYFGAGKRFLLWYPRWLRTELLDPRELVGSPSRFLERLYDPTNGTVSEGILALLVTPEEGAGAKRYRLLPGRSVYPRWFDRPIGGQ
jgi:hypothetical protein